ncbi:MAG: FKBP-type peptidyl-prolyl cis-trans isomerase [Deltaproteobacteria bacterium]
MNAAALLLLALAADPAAKAPSKPAAPAAGMTERQKTVYALGVSAAESFKVFELKPEEVAVLSRGLSDALNNKPLKVDMQTYRPKVNALAQKGFVAQSKALLARYGAEKGAVTTATGLVYLEVKPGEGAKPGPEDTVKVHYEGRLPDGTVFDSSRRRGDAASLPLDKVIKCWQEGIQKMKVGGQATIACPAELAYGETGRPPTIPPNAALVFQVELVGIGAPGK